MNGRRRRGEVVTHAAIFAPYNRPYVLVGREPHPDYPDQYVALGITTQAVAGAIALDEPDWEIGRLSEDSYIDPRYPTVLAERGIVETVGAVRGHVIDEAVDRLCRHVSA